MPVGVLVTICILLKKLGNRLPHIPVELALELELELEELAADIWINTSFLFRNA